MCLVLFARQFGIPILHGSEKCEKTDQFGSTKCDCTRFKVHHFWGPGLSDECSPVSSGSWNLFLRALAWAWLDCQSQASLLWSTHMKMAQNWVISGIQKTRCFKKQKQNSGGSLYLFFLFGQFEALKLILPHHRVSFSKSSPLHHPRPQQPKIGTMADAWTKSAHALNCEARKPTPERVLGGFSRHITLKV